jgi:hypothetical protein
MPTGGHVPIFLTLCGTAQNTATEPYLDLPPVLDPCSKLFTTNPKGSVVEVSVVVEKILELDSTGYTFEVIFNIAFMWEEDRVELLPEATPSEMDACPESARCGMCFFQGSETCVPRMANGGTNPRNPPELGGAMGLNKCCKDLWNPLSDDPMQGVYYPNAKEVEVLTSEGPSYYTMPGYSLAYVNRRQRAIFYVPMDFQKYPFDKQYLDMQMTTMARDWQINISNMSNNPNATGYYRAGGSYMPTDVKDEFELNKDNHCGPEFSYIESSDAAPLNPKAKTNYEDLSGWSISKNVQVRVLYLGA